MDFTRERELKLSAAEAKDLASILFLSTALTRWRDPETRRQMRGPNTDLMYKLLGQADVSGVEPPEFVVVEAEHVPLLATMGVHSVAHPQEVLEAFCRPNSAFCESYRPDLEPAAKAALQNVAAIVARRDGLL